MMAAVACAAFMVSCGAGDPKEEGEALGKEAKAALEAGDEEKLKELEAKYDEFLEEYNDEEDAIFKEAFEKAAGTVE